MKHSPCERDDGNLAGEREFEKADPLGEPCVRMDAVHRRGAGGFPGRRQSVRQLAAEARP